MYLLIVLLIKPFPLLYFKSPYLIKILPTEQDPNTSLLHIMIVKKVNKKHYISTQLIK